MPKTIVIKPKEFFNEVTNRIITVPETTLVLEHSLISVSKWEAFYKKPFLVEGALVGDINKIIYYLKCMTISPQKVDDMVYYAIDEETMKDVVDYINDPMTATWFAEDKMPPTGKPKKKEVLTSEVIYWQMSALQIPWECQKWHLNRLLTLIRVCGAKNEEQYGEKPKMSKGELLKRNAALNAQRRAKMHTRG